MILLLAGKSQPPLTFPLTDLVARTADDIDVEPRALMVRARQQLPRIARFSGHVDQRRAEREVRFCALRLRSDVKATVRYVPHGPFTLSELVFAPIDEAQAAPLLARLHYLRSLRPNSQHFALLDPVTALPVALCSAAVLQWPRLERRILDQFGIAPSRVLDISRVFAVDDAPANSISTLLSRVRTWVRQHHSDIELLTTVVDPNLGFTGSSYRAANWQLWMSIKARPYFYHRRNFITPRQLLEQFGTSNFSELLRRDPRAFEMSRPRLDDSLLYCCRVRGGTEALDPTRVTRLYR